MIENFNAAIIIDPSEQHLKGHSPSGLDRTYQNKRFGWRPNHQVNTEKDFVTLVKADLKRIQAKPLGRDLIDLIVKRHSGIGAKKGDYDRGKTVTIINGFGTVIKDQYNTFARTLSTTDRNTVARRISAGYEMRMAGEGSSVVVEYNPKQDYTALLKLKTPSYIALAHELIHAWHWLSGNWDNTLKGVSAVSNLDVRTLKEEAYTIGAGTYKNTRISENSIRKEHKLPLRSHYNSPGDLDLSWI